jgi:hypothetical protein
VLTPAERQLIGSRVEAHNGDGRTAGGVSTGGNGHDNGNGNGRSLLKQVRSHMVATGRQRLESIIEQAVGVKLVSVHHDISTVTGEEIIVFSLVAPPTCRPKKKA